MTERFEERRDKCEGAGVTRRQFLAGVSAAAMTVSSLTGFAAQSPTIRAELEDVYLFAYFRGGGQDGLHLAWSRDGLRYRPVRREAFLVPEVGESKLMRDPCLRRGPDGTIHMVWTTAWKGRTLGYASSKDLMNWTGQQAIEPFGDLAGVKNIWAPEIVWDEAAGHYMIFWSSTIEGRFSETAKSTKSGSNHRLYYITTRDFRNYTEPKLLMDPGFNTIDGTFIRVGGGRGGMGGQLYLVVKDESEFPEAKKHLRLCEAASYTGPFGAMRPAFTGSWVEGPSVVQVGDRYVCFYDCYGEQHYSASETTDFATWKEIRNQISLPRGIRHGTVLKVPYGLVSPLL